MSESNIIMLRLIKIVIVYFWLVILILIGMALVDQLEPKYQNILNIDKTLITVSIY